MSERPGISRLLDLLAIALLAIVALAVIPLGGNRPFVWGAIGLGLSLVVLGYALAAWWQAAALPGWRWEAWAFTGFLALAVMQLFPIASSLQVGGQIIEAATLSLSPTDSVLSLLTWVQYGLLFAFAMLAGGGRRRGRWMLETLFWLACAQAAVGLVGLFAMGDTVLGAAKTQYQGFATGTFVNRNSFATYVAAAIPIGVAILATRDTDGDPVSRRWITAARAAGVLVLVASLLASGSRMGLVAGAVGTALAVVLILATGRGRGRIPVLLGGALCVVLVVAGFGAPLLQRLVDPGDDVANRLTLYAQVWEAILARPLFGYGGGSFASVFPVFQHAPLPGDLVWQRAHSTYLALWFEYGLLAGSIPILIVAGLWMQCVRWLFRHGVSRIVLATAASIPVFALHSAVDFSLEIHAVAMFMAVLLGLGIGAVRAALAEGTR